MLANVHLRLDRVYLSRLRRLGYLSPTARDPECIHDAVMAALADRLAPNPETLHSDVRH